MDDIAKDLSKKNILDDIFKHRKIRRKASKNNAVDEFLDLETFKMMPVTMKNIEDISKAMVKFVLENEDVTTLRDFSISAKINFKKIFAWARKFEVFKEAYEFCRDIMFARRDNRAKTGQYNSYYILKSIHHFAIEHREDKDKELSKNKQDKEPVKVILGKVSDNE